MSTRSLYTIFSEPVRMEKVADGIWKFGGVIPQSGDEKDEYLRSVELFVRPMRIAVPNATAVQNTECVDKS